MSHTRKQVHIGRNKDEQKPVRNIEKQEALKTQLLDEFPSLPEKFYTFTHEMIALLWMKETTQTPIRGEHISKS